VKARDELRVGGLQRDQQLVVERVARQPVARADADPLPPAVAGQQVACGLLESLAVLRAPLRALVVGQPPTRGLGHQATSRNSKRVADDRERPPATQGSMGQAA